MSVVIPHFSELLVETTYGDRVQTLLIQNVSDNNAIGQHIIHDEKDISIQEYFMIRYSITLQ